MVTEVPASKKIPKRWEDGIGNSFDASLNSLMQRRPALIIILHLELRALVTHDNHDVMDHLLGAMLGGRMQRSLVAFVLRHQPVGAFVTQRHPKWP